MEDQNDLGAKDSAINKQIPATKPMAIITNPPITIPVTKRLWFKITVSLAVVVAGVTIIAGLTEIPNNVMGWFINGGTLLNKKEIGLKDRLILTVRTISQFDLVVLTNRSLLFESKNGINQTNIAGILYLPFPDRTPEVELRFGVKNPSEREVELASIGVGMPSWVISKGSPEWKTHIEGDWRGYSSRLDEPMLRSEPWCVFPIKFLTFGTNISRPFPMTVTVYDKECPPYSVAFWVAIIPMNIATNPNPYLVILRN